MARRTATEKAETHDRIVHHASQAFRTHGSGVGIGDVMKELGLTHGGFYRHFESKDDLVVEAVTLSLEEVADRFAAIAEKAPPGEALAAIISAYLSLEHLRHPESWCALATLAPELARQPLAVRKRLDGALVAYMEKMARYMPGETGEERRGTFLMLFSGMAGAIAMARVPAEKETRERVLTLAREYYLRAFTSPRAR